MAEFAPYLWAAITLAVYGLARALYRRHPRWWTSPLLLTWAVCGLLLVSVRTPYHDYLRGTAWLSLLLGPATVAFALPIYEQRALIRRHAATLVIGVVAGSLLAVLSAWGLAELFHLSPEMRQSLLPRSVTMPFAVPTSRSIGGVPELTATLVGMTALFGAAVGEWVISRLPLQTSFARGALFGMGAHGAGVAKARELGQEEGAVAGLVMIFAGLVNVIGAAVAMALLHG